jgi:transposase
LRLFYEKKLKTLGFHLYILSWRKIFLPSYSPDKNPIEHTWANLKNWLRLHSKNFENISNAIDVYFKSE